MKGLRALVTGIAAITALGSSLEARANDSQQREFTVDFSYGYFLPKGELGNFYGPAGLIEGKAIWHGLSPEIGISMGANYYRNDGSSTTETRRTLFGGRRVIFSDTAELTKIGFLTGIRVMPDPSFYLEGGLEVDNLNETDKNNRFGQGFYGEAGFRIKIGDGKDKNSYFLFKVKGNSVKINKDNKPEVGGITLSAGLEFDIY